jgi:hypothetical protein
VIAADSRNDQGCRVSGGVLAINNLQAASVDEAGPRLRAAYAVFTGEERVRQADVILSMKFASR